MSKPENKKYKRWTGSNQNLNTDIIYRNDADYIFVFTNIFAEVSQIYFLDYGLYSIYVKHNTLIKKFNSEL